MKLTKPCHGPITSLFSDARLNPVLNVIRPHWGIDYGGHADNTIMAAADGKVRVAVNSGTGFGKYIVITHANGWETLYAHLSVISVSAGQTVKQGDKIGVKGTTGNSTGVHLHFELSKGKWSNKYTHHVNPAHYIDDPDVRSLQINLNKLGYPLTVDGIYGDAVTKAVAAYQKHHKLIVDGVAGRLTTASVVLAVGRLTASTQEKEEVDEMSETLPKTQQDDMRKLLKRAYTDKVFSVDHSSKVDKMTRGEALDLLISYNARKK